MMSDCFVAALLAMTYYLKMKWAWGILIWGSVSFALPLDRILMVDVGVGFPQMAGAEASVLLTTKWQVGATFGLLPGGNNIFPLQTLPEKSAQLSDGNTYRVTPQTQAVFYSISPYLRFFLANDRPVYLQMMLSAFTAIATVTSNIKNDAGVEIPGASLTGVVTMAQLLPTISLGHIWHSKFYFFNLSLGVSYVANIVSSTRAEITTPFPFDTSADEAAIATAFDNAAQQAALNIRNNVLFLPSIWLSFGLVL